jgi:hypothetical protein
MPNGRKDSEKRDLNGYLAGLIAQMPDEEPPPFLTAAVMRRLEMKQPSLTRRFWLSGRKALTAFSTPSALSAAVILGSLLAAIIFINTFFRTSIDGNPPVSPASTAREITFVFHWPSARHVAVIGSFNQWNPQGYEMRRDEGADVWRLTVPLTPGEYAYAFLVDQRQTLADPNALWQMEDGFGGHNSTIIVADGVHNENNI